MIHGFLSVDDGDAQQPQRSPPAYSAGGRGVKEEAHTLQNLGAGVVRGAQAGVRGTRLPEKAELASPGKEGRGRGNVSTVGTKANERRLSKVIKATQMTHEEVKGRWGLWPWGEFKNEGEPLPWGLLL